MKVLLLQPPISDFYHTTIRSYPFGLLYIASQIKDIEIKIYNARLGKPKKIENKEFKELEGLYKEEKISPFSLFKGFKIYGKKDEEILEDILKENPDIIGITSLFSAHFKEVKTLTKKIKEILPNCKIILGGIHPTIYPEVLKFENFDFLIRGEGETPFRLFLEEFNGNKKFEKINGLCFKNNGKIIINDINFEKNIDIIPERNLIEKEDYKWGGNYFSQVLTSRGCIFNCAFCGKIKAPFRKRALISLEEEIEYLERENIKSISLEDELLGFDENFFKEVLNLFKGKGFKLYCMNGIYLGVLKKDLIEEMFKAGFKKLNLSFVDISQKTLKEERRSFSNFFEKFKEIENFPLNYEVHYIIGLPNQKVEDVLELMVYLAGLRVLLAPSAYYFAPLSLDFKKYYKGEDFNTFRSSTLNSPNLEFSKNVIYTLLVLSRFINFIKMAIDRFEIKKFEDLIEIANSEIEKGIIKTLIKERKFFYFNRASKKFEEEPLDYEIVNLLFSKIKGKKIKGFKKDLYFEII